MRRGSETGLARYNADKESMMSDDRSQTESQPDSLPQTDPADSAIEQIIPPEQPPMDDAAGGPQVDVEQDDMDDVSVDDLSVQGGE